MDDRHFELWSTQLRRDNVMWNRGFKLGCICGVILGFLITIGIGLLAPDSWLF